MRKDSKTIARSNTLVNELLNFKVKITVNANDTYGAWREVVRDDLVLALALVCWYAERNQWDLLDDVFLQEKKQKPGPYFIDSYMMKPDES